MLERCDVAVVGGGPAGCACAITLRAHVPTLAIVLLEATDYEHPRIGETLPPGCARLLQRLGVLHRMPSCARPAYATSAIWGGALPVDHDFIFSPRSHGWQMDRRSFDAMLFDEARARGVRGIRRARVVDTQRSSGEIVLRLANDDRLHCRFVVDATGAAARIARRLAEVKRLRLDRLTGYVRIFDRDAGPPGVLVEAVRDGWWYTAPLPDHRRVAAFMTDADIGRDLHAEAESGWYAALECATSIREALGDIAGGRMIVRSATSRRLASPAGEDWIAIGDAGSTFDPLSSLGILKALRSGMFAGWAAGNYLTRNDHLALRRYGALMEREFQAYAVTRAKYYGQEQRWRDHEFWRRRILRRPLA